MEDSGWAKGASELPTRWISVMASLYLQHIGWDATFGDAVAVFADDALSDYRFSLVFPVGSAVKRKIINRLDRRDVAKRFQPLRLRYPLGLHKEGSWMIVEAGRQYKVETLSAEQVSFVLAIAVNDTALAELFDSGWTEREPFPLLSGQPT